METGNVGLGQESTTERAKQSLFQSIAINRQASEALFKRLENYVRPPEPQKNSDKTVNEGSAVPAVQMLIDARRAIQETNGLLKNLLERLEV